jgi:iron complex transport system ATP-binding protein
MSALFTLEAASFARNGRRLIREAHLEVKCGALTVIIGPNGAGKSTLLRLMSGELRPTSGVVRWEQQSLAALEPWRLARRRAFLSQSISVSSPFLAAEIVELGLAACGSGPSPQQRARILAQALAAAEVSHLAPNRYDRLSGGEQRRVQFARALAQLQAGALGGGRQALLLDEPIANLDLRHQLRLLDEARRLARQGVAVVAVLHELNFAARYADALVVMRDGAIVAAGAPEAVLTEAALAAAFGLDLRIALASVIVPSSWAAQAS